MDTHLKSLRTRFGISQEKLSQLIGCSSRQQVITWEKGRFQPSPKYQNRIFKLFSYLEQGIPVDKVPDLKTVEPPTPFTYNSHVRESIWVIEPGLYTSNRRKLKQSEVAKALKVNPNLITRWENGTTPSPEHQEQLAKLFRILRQGTPIKAIIDVGLNLLK